MPATSSISVLSMVYIQYVSANITIHNYYYQYRMAVGAVQAAQASTVLGVLQWMQVKLWICSL